MERTCGEGGMGIKVTCTLMHTHTRTQHTHTHTQHTRAHTLTPGVNNHRLPQSVCQPPLALHRATHTERTRPMALQLHGLCSLRITT